MERHLGEDKNEMLGDLDHLNSLLGLAKSFIKDRKIKKLLTIVQNDIFGAQTDIVQSNDISQRRIFNFQMITNGVERGLKKLDHFIIPEGAPAACLMHCIRTTARNIERKLPGYLYNPTNFTDYLDRLSCLMFALARAINQAEGFVERAPEEQNPKERRRK